jgi:hypothetical protein
MHQAAIRSLGLVENKLMRNLPEEKAKRRAQTQAITKQLQRFIRRWKATKKEGRCKKHNSTNKGK